jgi:hypothetical protein
MADKVVGDIPKIIRNADALYKGDLTHYFRILFFEARNVNHPYHNFRHMTHVLWLCYDACLLYKAILSPREMRNILIAAMFHDFDHSGMMGHDDLNIERAVRGFQKHIHPIDVEHEYDIIQLLRGSEFPHKESDLGLSLEILRDADVAQALSTAWIQQIVFGLAAEWGKPPIEVLRMQPAFNSGIRFNTEWAKQRFPKKLIAAKVAEAEALIACLKE